MSSIVWSEAPQRVLNIAREVINQYHPLLNQASIAFVIREGDTPERNGIQTLGKASKFPDKVKALIDEEYDFLIWLAEEVLSWEDAKLTAVIDHELCHCDYTTYSPKIRQHDIEEFNVIIERHGLYKSDLVYTMNAFRQNPLFDVKVSTSRSNGGVGTVSGKKLEGVSD